MTRPRVHCRAVCAFSCVLLACACRTAKAQTGDQGEAHSGAKPALAAKPAPSADQAASKGVSAVSWDEALNGQAVEIAGILRRVGNEPFDYLVLTDDDGNDWVLDKTAQKDLATHETKRLRVSAVVSLKKQTLANGKRLPDKRVLTQVTLLE